MTNIKKIYDKYLDGDPITDEELKEGIKHFIILEKYLNELGERFFLTWKEVYRVKRGLEEFKEARAKR